MLFKFRRIIVPLFIAGILAGCGAQKDDSEQDVKPRATVEVARAELGDIDNIVRTTGSFQVLRDEKIKSTISGKVEKVFVLEGDVVRKGQPIATILSQESNAAITGATQMVEQAQTGEEKKQAEEALRLAENTAVFARVTAPFAGAITNRFVTEGELVAQGTDLVEMIDPKTEYFIAEVPVGYASSIRSGESAVISMPNLTMKPLNGVVEAVNPSTDPNSQSIEVRIGIANDYYAVPVGTFGNVSIKIGEKKSVVLVPKQAVYHDDELDRYFVWRVQGDSLALLTQVNVGLADSASIQITAGVKPGDEVATVGGYGLPDSTDVTVSNK